MRSVLLPMTPNYAVAGLWFKFYERWQDEVDKVEVNFNTKSHGKGIKDLVLSTKANYIMLAEYDGIVFKKGFVDEMFSLIEEGEYDIVGSPRMSCTPEVAEVAKKKFNLDYEGYGDRGPHFWPCFFFTKTSLLEKTDMHFESFGKKKGEYIKMLDHEVKDVFGGDTFTWTSLQLRSVVKPERILEINQYHSSLYDLEDYRKNINLFDGKCDRFHIGSIAGNIVKPNTDQEKWELERRIMWLELAGLDQTYVIKENGLSRSRVNKTKKVYKELVQWK